MSKFKVGDRVKRDVPSDSVNAKDEGTITAVDIDHEEEDGALSSLVKVKWDGTSEFYAKDYQLKLANPPVKPPLPGKKRGRPRKVI